MIFTLDELSAGRYRATNTLTGVAHVTYGTELEVREQLEVQSAKWEAKAGKKLESPWRKRAEKEARKQV